MEELRSCMPLGVAKRLNNNKISKCGGEVMARGRLKLAGAEVQSRGTFSPVEFLARVYILV